MKEQKHKLLDMLGNIMLSQAKVREVYLEFLTIIKSSKPDYPRTLVGSLDVWLCIRPLLDNLMKMSTSETSFMIPMKDKIEPLHHETRFLGGFMRDMSSLPLYNVQVRKLKDTYNKLGAVVCTLCTSFPMI